MNNIIIPIKYGFELRYIIILSRGLATANADTAVAAAAAETGTLIGTLLYQLL
jgi:hypothetical protein